MRSLSYTISYHDKLQTNTKDQVETGFLCIVFFALKELFTSQSFRVNDIILNNIHVTWTFDHSLLSRDFFSRHFLGLCHWGK